MREKPWLGSAPELVARHPLELVCGMLQHLPHSSWDSGAFGLLWLCSAISSTHGLCRALNLTAWPQNHSVFRARGWREKCTGGARMGLHHLSLLSIFLDSCFTREKILLALPFLTLLPWGMPFWSLPLNFPKPRVIPNIHPHLSVLQPLACPFSVAKCLDCLSGSPLGTQTLVLTAPKMHLWAPNLHLENETETPQLVPALGRAFLTHHNHHPTVCRLSCPTFQKNPQVFIYLFISMLVLSVHPKCRWRRRTRGWRSRAQDRTVLSSIPFSWAFSSWGAPKQEISYSRPSPRTFPHCFPTTRSPPPSVPPPTALCRRAAQPAQGWQICAEPETSKSLLECVWLCRAARDTEPGIIKEILRWLSPQQIKGKLSIGLANNTCYCSSPARRFIKRYKRFNIHASPQPFHPPPSPPLCFSTYSASESAFLAFPGSSLSLRAAGVSVRSTQAPSLSARRKGDFLSVFCFASPHTPPSIRHRPLFLYLKAH